MSPILPMESEDFGAEEETSGRSQPRLERFQRQKASRRVKTSARRSRTNEMAKRGMHQRRNKRSAW